MQIVRENVEGKFGEMMKAPREHTRAPVLTSMGAFIALDARVFSSVFPTRVGDVATEGYMWLLVTPQR